MESKKNHLKNWVVLTPIDTKNSLIDQIENKLSDQEIEYAYDLLRERNSGPSIHRISRFSWNHGSFNVILESGVSFLI